MQNNYIGQSGLQRALETMRRETAKSLAWAYAGQPTGNWADDCALGRAAADEIAAYIAKTGDHALLGGIVSAIGESGRFSGIECGLFARISQQIAQSAFQSAKI